MDMIPQSNEPKEQKVHLATANDTSRRAASIPQSNEPKEQKSSFGGCREKSKKQQFFHGRGTAVFGQ